MTFHFRPASAYGERHGCFIALVGGTNSGKSFSALRLARGIAGEKGRIAVLDTEGGRTLHLKDRFAFDVDVMSPPHRPERYLEAARVAQDAGYRCLVIDSFSMEWRGVGGVLDWIDEEAAVALERRRAYAEQQGWRFDEGRERDKLKAASSIRPKMAHKLMVSGLIGLRMPIVFAIRGEEVFDPETKKAKFKAQCSPAFPFEVTVSFRLASDRKGVIDLSDPEKWKMEGAHAAIFKDGEQLSERHGELLEAWAGGAQAQQPAPQAETAPPPADWRWRTSRGETRFASVEALIAWVEKSIAKASSEQIRAARERNGELMAEYAAAGHADQMLRLSRLMEDARP